MLDPKVVTKMVEDQIARSVNDQVLEVFAKTKIMLPYKYKQKLA
jgi:hypothetical protein